MKAESMVADNPIATTVDRTSEGIGNLKNIVADKLHLVAQTISQKAEAVDTSPEVARYGKQASDMLDQSADYLRDLDFQRVEQDLRNYVKGNPGRSLIIAGIAGLAIGALLRRR